MKNIVFVTLCLVTAGYTGTALAQAADPARDIIGTWRLVGAERGLASGEPVRSRGARGLLIFDGAGNVFEYFDTGDPGDASSAQSNAERTLASVGGFWGRYTLDAETGRIDFESEDGVSPSVRGIRFSRQFELARDQLIVTSSDEPQAQGHVRWTWQRMPIVEHLSPAYREVVGFWRHEEERRVNTATGEVTNVTHRAPSLIVYTPSGFVGVHFPPQGRGTLTSSTPTAEEAQAAMRGYIGYFGTLGVYPGEVSHNILSGVSPGTGSILRRYAAISGDRLVVTLQGNGPQTGDDRPRTVTEVELRRLSSADDMLPASAD